MPLCLRASTRASTSSSGTDACGSNRVAFETSARDSAARARMASGSPRMVSSQRPRRRSSEAAATTRRSSPSGRTTRIGRRRALAKSSCWKSLGVGSGLGVETPAEAHGRRAARKAGSRCFSKSTCAASILAADVGRRTGLVWWTAFAASKVEPGTQTTGGRRSWVATEWSRESVEAKCDSSMDRSSPSVPERRTPAIDGKSTDW
mmetsp:Transcript_1567/g.4767  ORF Transcript_1567/g.4767 Transcript_1567/m.4767 type:complete len:205 (-) Transcript_1567:2304-2918(-)